MGSTKALIPQVCARPRRHDPAQRGHRRAVSQTSWEERDHARAVATGAHHATHEFTGFVEIPQAPNHLINATSGDGRLMRCPPIDLIWVAAFNHLPTKHLGQPRCVPSQVAGRSETLREDNHDHSCRSIRRAQAAAGVKGLKVALAYATPKGTLSTPTWAMND